MNLGVCPGVEGRFLDGAAALIGCSSADSLWVLQAVPAGVEPLSEQAKIEDLLPYGLRVCGTYASSNSAAAAPAEPWITAFKRDEGVAYRVQQDGLTLDAQASVDTSALEEPVALPPSFLLARSTLPLTLDVYHSTTSGKTLAHAVQLATKKLHEQLANNELALLATTRSPAGQHIIMPSTSGSLSELLGSSCKDRAIQLQPLVNSSPAAPASNNPPAAPTFTYQPAAPGNVVHHHCVCLSLDVLCYLPANTPCASLASDIIKPSLLQQLQRAAVLALHQDKIVPVAAHHFLPPGYSHYITILYPQLHPDPELSELKLKDRRMQVHQLLGLPIDRPFLRLANVADPLALGQEAQQGSSRLRDVHTSLPDPPLGGVSYMVDGSYEYYHYMQDRFDDKGWGCAYRSLQTLCSWFLTQKYTSKAVPSHREIQEMLVSLGDKPKSFIGSSSWIGATELMYILDSYLSITSKVIFISRGADIPSHARELAQHFSTQGTPVMIGGGVLAYTLLGVHFNEQTGDCAFLILDPHYTGGEDLKKIQAGTWVAWKKPGDNAAAGGPLFVQDAFYNFLCPQRPSTV